MFVLNQDEDVDAQYIDVSRDVINVVTHTIKFRVAKLFINPCDGLLYCIILH